MSEVKDLIEHRLTKMGIEKGTYFLLEQADEAYLKFGYDDTVYPAVDFEAEQALLEKYDAPLRWGHNNGLDAVYFSEGVYMVSRNPRVAEVMQEIGASDTGLGVILSNGDEFAYADGRPNNDLNIEWRFVRAFGDKIRKDREKARHDEERKAVEEKISALKTTKNKVIEDVTFTLTFEKDTYLLFGPNDANVCVSGIDGEIHSLGNFVLMAEEMKAKGQDMVWSFNGGITAVGFKEGFYLLSPDPDVKKIMQDNNVPEDSMLPVALSNGGQFVLENGHPNKWLNHAWKTAESLVSERDKERDVVVTASRIPFKPLKTFDDER